MTVRDGHVQFHEFRLVSRAHAIIPTQTFDRVISAEWPPAFLESLDYPCSLAQTAHFVMLGLFDSPPFAPF